MPQISIREMDVMEKLWDANMKIDMLHVFGGVCVRVCIFSNKTYSCSYIHHESTIHVETRGYCDLTFST